MADNFGLKIGLEGEKEFKKALSDINQSFKVLGSEMKLVSSQFDKNNKSVQALSARSTVLNKEIEAQKARNSALTARRHCLIAMWGYMSITPSTPRQYRKVNDVMSLR